MTLRFHSWCQTLCRVSSGPRGRHQSAEVRQNQTRDSGGSLRLLGSHQTPAGAAERHTAQQPQQQPNRRCVRETDGRGEREESV